MKLLEQQRSPIAGLLVAGHQSISPSSKQRGRELSLTKKPFQTAIMTFLIRPTGRTTPMQLEIKLIAPNRQAGAPRLQVIEIGAQGSGLLCHSLRLLFPKAELFQHLGSGTATMISNPWEPDRLLHPSGRLKIALLFCHRDRIGIGADSGQHER
jgi:hypothetical protein